MNNKLFIGSLSFNTTEEGLRAAFAQFGNVVSVKIMIDRMTNRPRGFGFVEMETEGEAQAAIEGMDGKELDGRPIAVNIARPMEERPPRTNGPRY